MSVTIFVSDNLRVAIWAVFVAGWVVGSLLMDNTTPEGVSLGATTTDSMVERFGLFTIIVLGEVVVGVVDGLSDTERTFRAIATGMIGLTIGFGFWWSYFDFVGRRLPRPDRRGFVQWMLSHLPVTLSITAAGAAMVGLVEHAGDTQAPAATTWLLAGSVALMSVCLVVTRHSLADYQRLIRVYRPLSAALIAGAGVALLTGWWRPAPWLLVLVLAAVQSAIWVFGVDRWLRYGRDNRGTPDS